jgi:NADPH:quinone reductase-like Zn-dependent oxidoreductase
MNAAVLHTLGKPPRFEEFPEPIPGEGEVIVHVRATALKPVDKQMASGSHYAGPRELPVVCGIDGVGSLDDGTRVFFGGPRRPYGAMAERTVLRRAQCFPVPDSLSDDIAAALPNPAVSAWLTLKSRAKLASGETVLILGATGVAGRLAVQIAKLLGAGRVIAAGRNEQVLKTLHNLGADATIQIDKRGQNLTEAFAREAGDTGFQVVVDYLWGHPTEALLAALTRNEFAVAASETRLVQVGESAGAAISLPAAALRSTPLTIVGTAGMPSLDILTEALQQVMAYGANGKLRIDTERVPLADIANAWQREQRSRLVIIP